MQWSRIEKNWQQVRQKIKASIISAKGRNGTAELLQVIANAEDDTGCTVLSRDACPPIRSPNCGDRRRRQAHPCLAPLVRTKPTA